MHEYIPVIILVVGLFAGIWLNRRDFSELKADTSKQFADAKTDTNRQFEAINKRLDHIEAETSKRLDHIVTRLERVDSDLRDFYGTDKQLEGRINELSARVK